MRTTSFMFVLALCSVASMTQAQPLLRSNYKLQAGASYTYSGPKVTSVARSAKRFTQLAGTWAGEIIEADGSSKAFTFEMANMPYEADGGGNLPGLATATLQADGSREYRGGLDFFDTIYLRPKVAGETLFIGFTWDGSALTGTGTVGVNGRVVSAKMTHTSDAHPFSFKPAVLHMNGAPLTIEGSLHFPSPQTASTKSYLALAGSDGVVLANYYISHSTGYSGGGAGGVISFNAALANPGLDDLPCMIYTKLDGVTRHQFWCREYVSASVVSTNPWIFRADNESQGLHLTWSEPEDFVKP